MNVVEVETRRFVLDTEDLEKVSHLLLEEFHKGLSNKTYQHACLKMLTTCIRDIPNGKEHGKFLAIELGEINLTIFYIDLNSNRNEMNVQSDKYGISKALMEGTGQQLFDYIVECLDTFVLSLKIKNRCLPLGFAFTFPCIHNTLNNAVLLRWTKGFSCSDVVGKDIGELLKEAMERKGSTKVKIMSVINNSTGVLMACAYKNKNCHIGLIVGAGTNASYMEDLDNIGKWPENNEGQPRQMIINTEWGAFGDNNCLNFIRTKYDIIIDSKSTNPGQQTFEKMISGVYLGEIVRVILVDFVNYDLLFKGQKSDELQTPYSFKTEWLKSIENDVANNKKSETLKVLKTLNLKYVSEEDCEIVKITCTRILQRSAFLVSAALATILNKLKRPETIISIAGAIFNLLPSYKILLETKLKELTSPHFQFQLLLPEYGSGVGAALAAAIALRNQDNS